MLVREEGREGGWLPGLPSHRDVQRLGVCTEETEVVADELVEGPYVFHPFLQLTVVLMGLVQL